MPWLVKACSLLYNKQDFSDEFKENFRVWIW